MSLGFSRFGIVLGSVWILANCLPLNHALAQGKPQPRRAIEISETNSAEILTNLNQLNTKKESLKTLDEQLRTLRELSPGQSMEDRFSLPYVTPTVRPNKKVKELLERQKNWAFTPEALSLSAAFAESDIMSGFANDKKADKNVDNKSSLQQFYDGLNRQESGMQGSDRATDTRSVLSRSRERLNDKDLEDDSGLPPVIRDKTQELKKSMDEDPSGIFGPARAHTSFDDFFGLSTYKDSSKSPVTPTKPSSDSFLEQYKKGLDPSVAVHLNPALGALLPNANANLYGTPVMPELKKLPGSERHDQPEPTTANINSFLNRAAVSDLNATVLNQWNPLYTPSKLELPKVAPITAVPNFELPRRHF